MKGKALTGGGLGIDSVSMSQGVSRCHSTLRERAVFKHYGGLTNKGRANIKMFQIKHGSPERGSLAINGTGQTK